MKVFKVFFSGEEQSEMLRKQLAKRPFFNVHDAFAHCDAGGNGFITRSDLKTLLKNYQYYPSDQELTLLIDRYDKNKDTRISYSEFMDEIMPRSST